MLIALPNETLSPVNKDVLTSFVPELVDSWEDGDRSVPDVAGVVHLAALHLHLGVLQPQSDVAVVDVQRSLVNGTSPENRGSSRESYSQVYL